MKKSRGIITLIVLAAMIAGLCYTAICGLGGDKSGSASSIKLGLDLAGGVSITYEVAGDEDPSSEDMADTVYKLQQRVDAYSTEAQVFQEGSRRITIEIPGVTDANAILEDLGTPGTLYFISQTDSAGNENYTYGYQSDADGNIIGFGYTLNKTIEDLIADGSVVLTGTDVSDARAGSTTDSMQNSQYVVDLSLTEDGAKKFATATQKAFNAGETIAIYYDGEFASVPSVNTVIEDGNAQITNMESFETAEALASKIRIGGLSLELQEIRSRVVGAQLGEEAINSSLKAAAVGFALVVIFMIGIYFIPGIAASLALTIYTALMIILIYGFDITLTLPGIAGIILSVGMAVDANVVIFARIREELATGKTVQSAVKIGFNKALSAILDGNITTLIAAGVLGFMGTGSIKGFAQTLALGIVLSMFTALFVTKWIIYAFYAVGLQNEKMYGIAKEKKPINFLGKKNIFFVVSGVLIIAGIVAMVAFKANGNDMLNYSLEFKGGTSTTVEFNEEHTLAEIDGEITPQIEAIIGDKEVQATQVQGSNEVTFKTKTLDVTQRDAMETLFEEQYGVATENITTESISATVSDEMKQDAVLAVVIATVCMLLYIWFRFKDIRFGASSIIALVHDVLVVLAFYAIARVSVGNNFIACMLTLVGYSINATIVIFDRIRENMGEMKKKDELQDMVNRSITQTLSRSIFSSLTTFFMIAALYVFGVSSIREFALPLMVGIVCGTYSSICLTGALWYLMKTKFTGKKAEN